MDRGIEVHNGKKGGVGGFRISVKADYNLNPPFFKGKGHPSETSSGLTRNYWASTRPQLLECTSHRRGDFGTASPGRVL